MNYFQYMETKTANAKLAAVPTDVVEFRESPEVAGVYYSNSGIEVRPATALEIELWQKITRRDRA